MERKTAGIEMKTMGSRFGKLEEDRYIVHKSKDNCAVYTNRTEDRDRQIEQTTIVQCTNGTEDKDRKIKRRQLYEEHKKNRRQVQKMDKKITVQRTQIDQKTWY